MGCSVRRLSRTRSGTVRSRFLAGGIACFPLAAPEPPLALLRRQQRIACLSHGCCKNVLAANIDVLTGKAAELAIELGRVLMGKLLHAADSQQFEITQHGRSYGNQILYLSLRNGHGALLELTALSGRRILN